METIYRHYSKAFAAFIAGWCVVGLIAWLIVLLAVVLPADSIPTSIGALALVLSIIVTYTVPSIVACLTVSPSRTAIYFLNWFLGWTGIGWLIALLWALSGADARKGNLKYREDAEPEDSSVVKGWMRR